MIDEGKADPPVKWNYKDRLRKHYTGLDTSINFVFSRTNEKPLKCFELGKKDNMVRFTILNRSHLLYEERDSRLE